MNQSAHDKLREMWSLHTKLQDSLQFYRKHAERDVPKYRGMPFVIARENFSRDGRSTYSRLARLFKNTTDEIGVGHLWNRATNQRGWDPLVVDAMDILFPAAVGGDQPEKDPTRAVRALPLLEKAVNMMGRDLSNLELSMTSDPELFDASVDEIVEEVIQRLRRS